MSDKDKINKFDSIKESKGSNSEGGYSVPLPSGCWFFIVTFF